jgi:hypothetical protein
MIVHGGDEANEKTGQKSICLSSAYVTDCGQG